MKSMPSLLLSLHVHRLLWRCPTSRASRVPSSFIASMHETLLRNSSSLKHQSTTISTTSSLVQSPTKRRFSSTTLNGMESSTSPSPSTSTTSDPVLPMDMECCSACHGEGQVPSRKRRTKKQKRAYQHAKDNGLPLPAQKIMMEPCRHCSGTGIIPRTAQKENGGIAGIQPRVKPDVHVGIIGGGIGGLALAVACQHRSIPYTVYERDLSFNERSQGYGLTMQQGGKALQSLGLEMIGSDRLMGEGIHSKRHIVHTPDGNRVGEWGMKIWGRPDTKKEEAKRQNAHISRQQLRKLIYDQILDKERIKWGHKLLRYEQDDESDCVTMVFERDGENGSSCKVTRQTSVLVGADGIRSAVRCQKVGEDVSPLRYLGCIVILGIAPSPDSSSLTNDNETVFQTADGTTRLYAMPFSRKGKETANAARFVNLDGNADGKGETMWQLSFPMSEVDAKNLSKRGAGALKVEALERCGAWHVPIPDLLQTTPEELVSGYPVYDRDILDADTLRRGFSDDISESRVTLLGDAAHPMSPFKGQGANQALLDAVLIARALYKVFREKEAHDSDVITRKEREFSLGEVLAEYESNMLKRSAGKVKASADAAKFLHSLAAISEGNITRGAAARKNTNIDGKE